MMGRMAVIPKNCLIKAVFSLARPPAGRFIIL